MNVRRMRLLLVISLLVFGMAGVVSPVAAAENSFNPGYGTDPYFFSPGWAPTKLTYSFTDPDFFSSNWKPAKLTYSFSDPDFFLPTGKCQPINLQETRISCIQTGQYNHLSCSGIAG